MESQPERALILKLFFSAKEIAFSSRNGVSARKGIDTLTVSLWLPCDREGRNVASARKGIDTMLRNSLSL